MDIPEQLKYSKTHEWIRVEKDIAYIGITDYAQESLGDIVYVDPPNPDEEVKKDDEVSIIESVKAASPIYAPVSGIISEANGDLDETPELINQKPFDTFIFAIKLSDSSELDELMDAEEYEKFVEQEKT